MTGGRLAGLVIIALLAGACFAGEDPGPSATAPTAGAPSSSSPAVVTTTSVPPADPYAIPDVIDAAYVNRVLEALYAVDGDVVRTVVATGKFGIEEVGKFVAIYTEPQLNVELEQLKELPESDLATYRRPPGDRRATVAKLARADVACVIALVQFDFSDVLAVPPVQVPGEADRITLIPSAPATDRQGSNPTPWSIAEARVVRAGEEHDSTCG
ncbi:MAG: hypothetical protein ACRD1K_17210 [Acidimicrobiales bacterium]